MDKKKDVLPQTKKSSGFLNVKMKNPVTPPTASSEEVYRQKMINLANQLRSEVCVFLNLIRLSEMTRASTS